MMNDITDDLLVRRLRRLLAENKVKLTDIAGDTGIPYRTLQNQLNGESRLSALNLLKILDATGIPSTFLTEEGANLNVVCMVISLEAVLGDKMPRIDLDDRGEYVVSFPSGRTKKQLREDAFVLASNLNREYGIFSVHMAGAFGKAPGDPEPDSGPVS